MPSGMQLQGEPVPGIWASGFWDLGLFGFRVQGLMIKV